MTNKRLQVNSIQVSNISDVDTEEATSMAEADSLARDNDTAYNTSLEMDKMSEVLSSFYADINGGTNYLLIMLYVPVIVLAVTANILVIVVVLKYHYMRRYVFIHMYTALVIRLFAVFSSLFSFELSMQSARINYEDPFVSVTDAHVSIDICLVFCPDLARCGWTTRRQFWLVKLSTIWKEMGRLSLRVSIIVYLLQDSTMAIYQAGQCRSLERIERIMSLNICTDISIIVFNSV